MLTVHRLSCTRPPQRLFAALEFEVLPAEIVQVVGANGSGMSTLLHILMGLFLPDQGEVRWQGELIGARESSYAGALTYIGHKAGVKNNLTVLENIQLAAQLAGGAKGLGWESILAHFHLLHLQDTLCQKLSAGQRQRVGLTRLLLTEAPLWILDEPFTALDRETRILLQALIVEKSRQGGMVIFTSHHALDWGEGVILKEVRL